MLDGGGQACAGTGGVAEQVRSAESEVFDHPGEVVTEPLVAEGPVDFVSVAVSLQFDGDHAALHGQLVEQLSEQAGQPEATVHHYKGGAASRSAVPASDGQRRRGRSEMIAVCDGSVPGRPTPPAG